MTRISSGPTLMVRSASPHRDVGASVGPDASEPSRSSGYRSRSRRAISARVRAVSRAQLDQCRAQVPAEAIERVHGSARAHGEHAATSTASTLVPSAAIASAKHPGHVHESTGRPGPLAVERATDFGRELLEPVFARQEEMEVEEVVGRERCADPRLR